MEKLSQRSKLTQIELIKMIDKLPQEMRDSYYDFELIEVIENIAKRYKFNEDETDELFGVIYDILLGLLPSEEINHELHRRIGLEGDKAGFVRGELDAFILNHVRGKLNELREGKKEFSETGSESGEGSARKEPSSVNEAEKESDPYREPIE